MKNPFTILVADRNPHVREFLKRELLAEGFRIQLAKSAEEVLIYAFGPERIDLLILDPDLPDLEERQLCEKLEGRIPILPVVVHGFSPEGGRAEIPESVGFVEKMGNSIEPLKRLIYNLLPSSSRVPDPAPSKRPGA